MVAERRKNALIEQQKELELVFFLLLCTFERETLNFIKQKLKSQNKLIYFCQN